MVGWGPLRRGRQVSNAKPGSPSPPPLTVENGDLRKFIRGGLAQGRPGSVFCIDKGVPFALSLEGAEN